jgi:hypothetical protein
MGCLKIICNHGVWYLYVDTSCSVYHGGLVVTVVNNVRGYAQGAIAQVYWRLYSIEKRTIDC